MAHKTQSEWVSWILANSVEEAIDIYPAAAGLAYVTTTEDLEGEEETIAELGLYLPVALLQAIQANKERSQAAWAHLIALAGGS